MNEKPATAGVQEARELEQRIVTLRFLLTEALEAMERLANEAAHAVTEPRRFHVNEAGCQQALGTKTAQARLVIRSIRAKLSDTKERNA